MKRAPRRARVLRPTAAMVVGDGLLLGLSLLGLFFFQFYVYGLPGSRFAVLDSCLAAAALALLIFSLPKYRWAALLAAAALGVLLLGMYWDSVVQGAQAVYHTVAHVITESTGFPGEFSIPQIWTPMEIQLASDHFLTAVIFALALPLGWAVVRRRTFLPVLLLTLPWLIPAFLAEFQPEMTWLSLVAACWMARLLTSLTARRDPAGGARLTLAALPAALLVLYGICRVFPMEEYVYPEWASRAAQGLTEWGERTVQTLWEGENGLGRGDAASAVDLTGMGPRSFTGRAVLRVESDWTGRLYLRGAAYAEYTGESWERLNAKTQSELEELAQGDPLGFLTLGRETEQTVSATITHLNGSTHMAYSVYQPVKVYESLGGARYTADSYLRLEDSRTEYTVEFSTGSALDSGISETAYRQFVYEHYLEVPEELEAVLANWWQEVQPQTQPSSYSQTGAAARGLAEGIARALGETTQYDLRAPVTPEGEDFVAWFLTQSQRGYCVHYASAAVLLLRMNGIPARYVSGYTAQVDNGRALVPDSSAHAWVEIYLDGYGWYPVEVTPAAAFENGLSEETAPVVSEAEEEDPSVPSVQPEPEPSPESSEPQPSALPETVSPAEDARLGFQAVLCAAAALLLGAPVLVRILRRRCWNRLTTLRDHNRAVLEIYGWNHDLTRWGGRPNEKMENLARKARFSQHTLTEEEHQQALDMLRQEIARLSAVPSWKRPLFRYLFVWK